MRLRTSETDGTGALVRSFGHFPFGEAWYESSSDPGKFTSYTRDSGTGESGLDYAMFRQYNPMQARFMSVDLMSGHLAAPQSLNRYAYIQDPINRVDHLGLMASPLLGLMGKPMCWIENVGELAMERCLPAPSLDRDNDIDYGSGGGLLEEPAKPFYCNPKVLAAIEKAWLAVVLANQQTHDPSDQVEAGFVAYPESLQGDDPIKIQRGEANGGLKLSVRSGAALGMFHTHYAGSGLPSTPGNNVSGSSDSGDTLAAVSVKTDNYVISSHGLAVAPADSKDPKSGKDSKFLFQGANFSDWFKKMKESCK